MLRQGLTQQNPISSSLFDTEAIKQHIADTLDIPYDEAQMPDLKMQEYTLDQSFIDWTLSLSN